MFVSNHLFCCCDSVCCRLFVGPIAGGYLCSTLGFEWAAAVLSFAGILIVSVLIKITHFCNCPVNIRFTEFAEMEKIIVRATPTTFVQNILFYMNYIGLGYVCNN